MLEPRARARRGRDIGSSLGIQLLGGAGYLVLVLATQISTRRRFLVADFCGLVPVVAHYVLLDAMAGAAMSALYMLIDLTAAVEGRPRLVRRLFYLHYALALSLAGVTYQTPIDLLALLGTLAAIVSRQQAEMRHLLALIFVSCLGWELYGLLAGSIGQAVFSAVYAGFSLLGLLRRSRQTHN